MGQISYVPFAIERGQCPLYYSQLTDFVSLDPHGPVLRVNCPSPQVEAGKVITFLAYSVDNPKIWFSWTVSGGTIIEGKGTDRISVATQGLEGRRITATVAMRILGDVQIQETSCETEIIARQQ